MIIQDFEICNLFAQSEHIFKKTHSRYYKFLFLFYSFYLKIYFHSSLMIKRSDEKIIGNFKIGKIIGSGTFGKVRQGIHIPTGQKVAIKTLQKKKIKTNKDIQRIQKELQILKDIKHPNILRLLDVKQTDNSIFIVTQLVEGQQLYSQIVKRGTLSLDEACNYFYQLFQAVKFLHFHKISHRDIKPQNIIVNGSTLKLIDFGLSTQWTQTKTTMETPCGSPCYAAPEMVLGKKYDCRKVDIWAMGVTLYTMFVGKLPFQHQSTSKLYKMIECSDFEDVKGVPSYVNLLLRAMIEKDPKKRISINEIEKNIWIKDTVKQSTLKENMKSEWNEQVLSEMESVFSIPSNKIVTEIVRNSISELAVYYHLKMRKKCKKQTVSQDEYHEGPFHIQFVFKSYEVIESFLEKNSINYEWIIPQNQPELNDRNPNFNKEVKKQISINGDMLRVKKLKNLPKLLYLPLKNINLKVQDKNKIPILSNTADRSFRNLDSSRSQISKYCIETF